MYLPGDIVSFLFPLSFCQSVQLFSFPLSACLSHRQHLSCVPLLLSLSSLSNCLLLLLFPALVCLSIFLPPVLSLCLSLFLEISFMPVLACLTIFSLISFLHSLCQALLYFSVSRSVCRFSSSFEMSVS